MKHRLNYYSIRMQLKEEKNKGKKLQVSRHQKGILKQCKQINIGKSAYMQYQLPKTLFGGKQSKGETFLAANISVIHI